MLHATQLYPDGSVVNFFDVPPGPNMQKTNLRMVNGQLNPTMTMRPGETQRWRVLNATANLTFLLQLDGHQLHQIAKDGNTLNETWTRDKIHLSPGERVEVLIQAGPAGSYALRTLPIATGFNTQQDATLATLVVDGDAVTPQPLPTTLLPLEDLSTAEIDERRQITFQFGPPINPTQTFHWIDHQNFDANRDDQTVRLDTTEEWVIRNASAPGTRSISTSIRTRSSPSTGSQSRCATTRTTNVPPFGEITMRTRFSTFRAAGSPCHILMHEDLGMMGTVKALA